MAFDMFMQSDYTPENPPVLDAYADQMIAFLKTQDPSASEDALRKFVWQTINTNKKNIFANVVTHPEYGRTELKTYDLLSYIDQAKKSIVSPSGTVYEKADVKESVLRVVLKKKTSERSVYKKKMLSSTATGNTKEADYYNGVQASAKRFNNSMFGTTGNQYNILYDKATFNSITSIARYCAMGGYGYIEKFLRGNMYLRSLNDVINYCTCLTRICPANTKTVQDQYSLYTPTVHDAAHYFYKSLRYYTDADTLWDDLVAYIQTLSDIHRTFIFYASNVDNLIRYNDAFFRSFFDTFFSRDIDPDTSADPADIFKIENDLRTLCLSINSTYIDNIDIAKAITAHPEGVKKIYALSCHMEKCLRDIAPIISTFLCVQMDIPNVMGHPNMVRRIVTVSDTDSAIFSTQHYIEWYTGKICFNQDAYDINAFVTFMVSQSIEHVFARISAGMGMTGDDIYRIKMKNEYLYPIMLRTPIKKHYAGIITIQEGKVLLKPKDDIKGAQLRGTNVSRTTTESVTSFIKNIINTVTETGELRAADCLHHVAEYEQYIYASLCRGDLTFFSTVSVKPGSEYKNGEDNQTYFHYMMWQEVFAPVYGDFVLPNKGYSVPILGNGHAIYDRKWHDMLDAESPGMGQRLYDFLTRNSHKKVSQILLPPVIHAIPQVFLHIMNARKIVYANGSPFYLVLNSLGLSPTYKHPDDSWLISDHYFLENSQDIQI